MTAYRNNGFQVITQLVSEPLRSQAISAINRITADYAMLPTALQVQITLLTALPLHQFSGLQVEDIPAVPYLIGELPAFGRAFMSLILLPDLWQHAAEILETETVVYHFSNVTSKPAGVGPRLNWHRDFPNHFICPHTSRFVRVLIPLDGMNPQNGCTQIVRNSHLISDDIARTGQKPSQMTIAPESIVDIACEPGDVAFLHPKSIHGGSHNVSSSNRRVVIIQLGAAGEMLETAQRESLTEYTYQQMKNYHNSSAEKAD